MEKKSARSAPTGARSRTWDLPRARARVPSCTPLELFRQVSLSVPIDRVLRPIAQHHVWHVLEIVFVRFCKILECYG